MKSYAAFLRAVNVSGTKRVAMAELRLALERAGFEHVRSLLQSGNLLFRAAGGDPAELAARLEREAAARLGLETDILVRTVDQLDAILDANPFVDEAKHDPAHLVVLFLPEPVQSAALERLRNAVSGPERIAAGTSELYITYPSGIGESRLTNAVIERALSARGTARNWNTVRKLAAAARDV